MRIPASMPFRPSRAPHAAFSLLEVMIAIGIFFMAIFAILELTSRSLGNARSLQHTFVDPSTLAAEFTLTNRLEEGSVSEEFGDFFPGARWTRNVVLESTNGLYRVDFIVEQTIDRRIVESRLSILMYRPDSVTTASGAATGSGAGRTTR
ncbi:MAG: hypothetical protein AB1705_28350 [Verrucomicrobiota bacterium]